MQYKKKILKGDEFLLGVYYIADRKDNKLIIGYEDEILDTIDMKKTPELLKDDHYCEMIRQSVGSSCERYKKIVEWGKQ